MSIEEISEEAQPSIGDALREAISQAQPEEDQPSEGDAERIEVAEDSEEAEPELPPIDAPVSWGADAKELFAQIQERALQEEIARREKEREQALHSATREKARLEKEALPYREAVKPFEEYLTLKGENPVEAVKSSLAWRHAIERNPVQAIMELARAYRIDPRQLVEAGGQRPAQQVDPAVAKVQAENQRIMQYLQMQQQQAALAQQQAVGSEIDAFANATDDAGNPMHPHFEALKDDMAVFAQAIRQKTPDMPAREVLKKAYNQALRANDELFQKEQAAREAEKQAKLKAETEKKKKASQSVKGAPSNGVSAATNTDRRELLRSALRQGRL